MTSAVRPTSGPARAPALPADVGRLIVPLTLLAIGANILLTIVDVGWVVVNPALQGRVGTALLAAAVALPLHLRHVVFGLRGARPPAGNWTLAALALVNVLAVGALGDFWLLPFASLAVSILIVARWPWAAVLCAAVILSPLLLAAPPFLGQTPINGALYYMLAIAWRAVTQFVPVRLVATIRRVAAAREELQARAVIQERHRIDAELQTGVGDKLQHIIARATTAQSTLRRDAMEAAAELGRLVADSRGALSEVRRLVAGYRSRSLDAEVRAAVALLEASGARVRVEIATDVARDLPGDGTRRVIHDTLFTALQTDPGGAWVVRVTRDGAGAVRIAVSRDDTR